MFVIDILLPLPDERGQPFPAQSYDRLDQLLTERFGAVTSFSRSPGESAGRTAARREFRQEDIVIRSQPAELLR